MTKRVYIVTHGDKETGANPNMTPVGFSQVQALQNRLPSQPSMVLVGTGRRHLDVATALGYITCHRSVRLRHPDTRFTPVVGGPESLEKIKGEDLILLADGATLPRNLYTGTEDGAQSMIQLLLTLPDNSVICAGRPSMILLGKKDAKSAAVYRVTVNNGDGVFHIAEVVATGVSEPRTV
ncbi:MAG: hypothetical protein A3J07_03745 [Candidatus Doudnabacteria bacterium RIFCSPLOWO2_02_FULL_49_13]|uniref:Uncharacterized protein n=1 Tax=Candidatus Doudnabacteria bacterium RIFCSPHIGHO2_12_FULL_48_16 TaxID=1817838 RepID=A0A1F5PJG9_9BACT|nr:MAG: hypothetical protein A3B77_02555 [Candidatus Doudnabacteria bacterium RIFCSPHIGHO2_02_FULL_49_24]OGE89588.1 MAG: hypothetical protein A2760_03760 [Candidatus Doudnabacteria bacterium RIFCSPHIGHO2_01_FULL_50_67]OGE90031.1 MAG: hypothetical protein A3E29_02890 [Candidatus Doudnabacteria bacterium RIFCSPHIGHO2_12_FULL_48_16]OGE96604.1 MAG: hypothetical protein A2990_00200 [Candidatus Doudnabacteria bacterium RIFCSPLOWO2_01_FULL_49_40]OGF03174.1 MAG: hypothetical protein A3J07_03745 [Candid